MRASSERHQKEIDELNSLSQFVQERSSWIEESEIKIVDDMHNTVNTIKSIRQYPKEKDVCLNYLNKYEEQNRFTPSKNYAQYYHEFNNFSPLGLKSQMTNYNSAVQSRNNRSRLTTL